jgi:hypothetical protein
MSGNIRKSSASLDEEIRKFNDAGQPIPSFKLAIVRKIGGPHFEQWVNNAFTKAQADKELILKGMPIDSQQPNPLISIFNQRFKSTRGMNSIRELGPGDIKK